MKNSQEQKLHESSEALVRIEEAYKSRSTKLKLSSLGLSSLPKFLYELTDLQVLDISHNRLTEVPEALGDLIELRELHLHVNRLGSLPKALARLTKLEFLSLTMNPLNVLPEFICEHTHLKELYLVNCQLLELPSYIGELVELQSLILADNKLSALPQSIGNLFRLQRLDLKDNELKVMPESISGLTRLEILELSNNHLISLPANIGRLERLKTLGLSRNQLRILPESIGRCLQVSPSLNISENQLRGLPASITAMSQLQSLDLHSNQVRTLPASIGRLKQLQNMDLRNNRLGRLPKSIGELKELKSLNISGNKLHILPESIGELRDLQSLTLDNNQLSGLPESIGRLTNLQTLNLENNQLSALPASIGQLAQLQILELQSNHLSVLPNSIGKLKHLWCLYVARNRLTALPDSIRDLRLSELSLDENEALGLPLEVLASARQDRREEPTQQQAKTAKILEYYFKLQAGSQPLNEAKLILVGRGAAGKTSIVNRLVTDTFKAERKTEGIKITEWKLVLNGQEDIRLNIWDFGGQEIMHATHQFFFTQRSLYLLVLNGREGGEDADAEYWLKLIESFGGDSPVIVVLNKIKEHGFDVNRRALQQKYPYIRDFIRTDCKDKTGIDELNKAICRETDRLEHLRDAFPASWFKVKDRLGGMRKNFLSFEDYRKQCAKLGEKDPKAQEALAFYLNSLGIALNYRDDPRLQDTHVLNPRWVTNGIYKLLNSDQLEKQKGEIRLADISRILDAKQYPARMHRFLFDLMRKFELCFSFPDDDTHYLIPELLDKQEPPEASVFRVEECLRFQYHYPVLPEGLLPRFIVRTHALSEGLPRWRTGAIMQFEDCRGLVKADVQDQKVFVSVCGPAKSRRRLLAVIRSDFERIHLDIRNLQPEEMVPVPGHPELVVPYKKLLVMEQRGVRYLTEVAFNDVVELKVQELLNGVDVEGTRRKEIPLDDRRRAVRVFYSYSHKDETVRNKLETHLKLLQRQGVIDTWQDRKIGAGNEWKEQIDENLERADIILLLISADFIASDYCYEVEMTRALERHERGEARVIPVIVRDVNWARAPFSKLQALPKDGLAVTKWPDKDSAWRNVSEGIESVVEEIRTKAARF